MSSKILTPALPSKWSWIVSASHMYTSSPSDEGSNSASDFSSGVRMTRTWVPSPKDDLMTDAHTS